MIKADGCDHRNRAIGNIGGIPLATQAALHYSNVNGSISKSSECQSSHHFKEGEGNFQFRINQFDVRLDIFISINEALEINRFTFKGDALSQ